MGLGALSTRSFASLRPNPVSSLTNFTTASFEPPAALRITSNSDFSSTCAVSVAAAGPATATAAAAGSIPYCYFKISANSLTTLTVKLTNFSAKSFKSAILLKFNC